MATGTAAAPASSPSTAPLAVAQEALWYRAQLDPTAPTYNEAISLRKDGPLDVGALRRAFNALVARHDAWRTTFDTVGGEPMQVVGPPPRFALPLLDLSALDPDAAEQEAVAVVAAAARVPYDLRRGPLLRPRLIRITPHHHRLYLAMHHLIFDGSSVNRIILPELIALYDAAREGRVPDLPDPPAYGDFARWQRAELETPRFGRRLAHWRRRLETVPTLRVPSDRPRPAAPASRGGTLELAVAAADVEGLRRAALDVSASLFQALAAAWALLLAARSGQDDVVFAVAADLRRRPEFSGVVGCAMTPLVVRVEEMFSGDPAFAELVVRVRNELLDGLDNVVAFERLARELPGTAAGANPIYQTMIVLEPLADGEDTGWRAHQIDAPLGDAVGASKLDLELQLEELRDGSLTGRLIYDHELFHRATAAALGDHWLRIVRAAAADPDAPVSRLPLDASDADRRQIASWNAARIDWDEAADGADQGPSVPATGLATPSVVELEGARGLAHALDLGLTDCVLVLEAARDADAAAVVWPALVAGARVVEVAPAAAGDPAGLRRLISEERVTFLAAPPDVWRQLLDGGLRPARGLRALTASRPGHVLSRELADAILGRCRALHDCFGLPGALGPCTVATVARAGPVTIGRPLPGTRAEVVERHGRPAAIGAAGELILSRAGATVRTLERARWRSDGQLELVS